MKITVEDAAKRLTAAKKVLITAHINPDGDAVGSSLALAAYLKSEGKGAEVVIDDKLPRNISFLPGYETIRRPSAGERSDSELLCVLDTDLSRIGGVEEMARGVPVLNIDHHISNDGRAESLLLEKRAATAEMIFEMLEVLGASLTPDIAICLYTGLATDTGFFKYSNTRPDTMRAAARLMEAGVRPNLVSEAVETKPLAVVRGEAAAFQTMEITADGRIAGLYIDKELSDQLETTDGFIDFVRVIEGVEVAVLIKCIDEDFCRVSMRSVGLDVSRIAMGFGGGGHIRAAGCTIKKPLAEAKRDVVGAIEAALLK